MHVLSAGQSDVLLPQVLEIEQALISHELVVVQLLVPPQMLPPVQVFPAEQVLEDTQELFVQVLLEVQSATADSVIPKTAAPAAVA